MDGGPMIGIWVSDEYADSSDVAPYCSVGGGSGSYISGAWCGSMGVSEVDTVIGCLGYYGVGWTGD